VETIVPAQSLLSGDKRFVLSTSGHILGIVNPPVNPAQKRAFTVVFDRRAPPKPGTLETSGRTSSGQLVGVTGCNG
jgi:polyhydroxyalkanoate synthase